jgi:hypothetical protein
VEEVEAVGVESHLQSQLKVGVLLGKEVPLEKEMVDGVSQVVVEAKEVLLEEEVGDKAKVQEKDRLEVVGVLAVKKMGGSQEMEDIQVEKVDGDKVSLLLEKAPVVVVVDGDKVEKALLHLKEVHLEVVVDGDKEVILKEEVKEDGDNKEVMVVEKEEVLEDGDKVEVDHHLVVVDIPQEEAVVVVVDGTKVEAHLEA